MLYSGGLHIYTTMDPRLIRKETTTLAPGQKPVQTTLAEGEIPFIMPPTTPRPETTTTYSGEDDAMEAPAFPAD